MDTVAIKIKGSALIVCKNKNQTTVDAQKDKCVDKQNLQNSKLPNFPNLPVHIAIYISGSVNRKS